MELNKKEKYLKSVLENSGQKLDTDLLWDSIESRVTQPRKDRKWLWFFSGVGSLILVLLITYPFVKDYILAEAKNSGQLSFQEETKEESSQIVSDQLTDVKFVERQKKEDIFKSQTSEITDVETNNSINLQGAEREQLNYHNASIPDFHQETNNSSEQVIETTSDSNFESQQLISLNENESGSSELNNSSAVLSNSEMTVVLDPGTDSNSEIKAMDELASTRIPEHEILLPLSILPGIASNEIGKVREIPGAQSTIKIKRPLRWIPFVSIRTGVNKVANQSEILSSDSDLNQSEFSREKGLFGYSADLQFGFENSNGWYVLSGLNLNQAVTQYENHDVVQSSQSINGVESIYTDRNGEMQQTNGVVNQTTITNFNVRRNRTHQKLNLQLMVGKELLGIKNWSLSSELGIHYNIHQSNSGYYFEDSHPGFRSFEKGEDNPYRSSGTIGFRGGINLNYHIKKISISLHSFYKYNPASITNADHFYTTKNKQLGLQLGLAYQLDRALF